jgi:hypothetical protein
MFHQLVLASDAACSSLGMLWIGFVMQDPFAEKTVYNDGPIDKLFIKLFTQKMADQLEGESTLPSSRPCSRQQRAIRAWPAQQLPGWQPGRVAYSLL